MPEGVVNFLTFIAMWIGLMALIGAALAVTRLFRKRDEETTVDPKEYAEKMEAELNEATPEKPIKKGWRNPFVLSADEIEETKKSTEDQ